MNNNYFNLKFGIPKGKKRIVALDTEWAKNWRAKEKFIPFCMTIHSIYFDENNYDNLLELDDFYMKSELYFRNKKETSATFVRNIDELLGKYLTGDTIFIGHQLSSDLHSLISCSDRVLKNVELIKYYLQNRKSQNQPNKFSVADTRYDIPSRIRGDEKLRNVSLRLNIFAVQTELDKISLTKMYNTFLVDNDREKMEKLLVMNWRHAFQTSLVWLVDSIFPNKSLFNSVFNKEFIVTNDIIYQMGNKFINYIGTEEYKSTTKYKEVLKYVAKYCPDNVILKQYN